MPFLVIRMIIKLWITQYINAASIRFIHDNLSDDICPNKIICQRRIIRIIKIIVFQAIVT